MRTNCSGSRVYADTLKHYTDISENTHYERRKSQPAQTGTPNDSTIQTLPSNHPKSFDILPTVSSVCADQRQRGTQVLLCFRSVLENIEGVGLIRH